MTEVLTVAITVVPVLLGAALGLRSGALRVVAWTWMLVFPLSAGAAVGWCFFRQGLFEPLGLVTPAAAASRPLRCRAGFSSGRAEGGEAMPPRRSREPSAASRSGRRRSAGGRGGRQPLGSREPRGGGLRPAAPRAFVAPSGSPAATGEGAPDLLHALLRTANRGFVRHVPWSELSETRRRP